MLKYCQCTYTVGYITYLYLAVFLKHIINTIIAMMVTIPPVTTPTMTSVVGSEISDIYYKIVTIKLMQL